MDEELYPVKKKKVSDKDNGIVEEKMDEEE